MKKFKVGTRVRYTGSPVLGPPYGSVGTVQMIAGAKGMSVHPDPAGIMTYVEWDGRMGEGVFTRMLERVKEG